MEEKLLNSISLTELPDTVEGCHAFIQTLSMLFKRIEKLEAENKSLKERLNNNSSNSSLPPVPH